jgi:hypothetical protein
MTKQHTRIVYSRKALNAQRLVDALDIIIELLEDDGRAEITTTELHRWRAEWHIISHQK